MKTTVKAPFSDLVVLELANVLAGPSVGMFFAELGALVIKVENPTGGGDVTRTWRLPTEDAKEDRPAYFCSANWGKKSVALNIQKEDDRKVLNRLLKRADLVLSSFKPGGAERLKLTFKDLKSINPEVILGTISGFGELNKRAAYDAIIQAESGFMFMNGHQDGPETKMPVALIDILAAHQLKEGLLTALIMKQRGLGAREVTVSLLDAALASMANQASNYLTAGHIAKRMGNEHPNIYPYGTLFTTKDQDAVMLAVSTNKQFKDLCQILQLQGVDKKKEYCDNRSRSINRKQLAPILKEAISTCKTKEMTESLLAKDVPYGILKSIDQSLDSPEAQKLVLQSQEGIAALKTNAFKISGTPDTYLTPPPHLDEDRDWVHHWLNNTDKPSKQNDQGKQLA